MNINEIRLMMSLANLEFKKRINNFIIKDLAI